MRGVPEMVEPLRTNLMTRYARELFSGNGKKYRDSKMLLKIEQCKQDTVWPEKEDSAKLLAQ